MVNNNEIMERVKIVREIYIEPILLFVHPISKEVTVYSKIDRFEPANPSINNYIEVNGKDITELLTIKWFSVYRDNCFSSELFSQNMDGIPVKNIKLPPSTEWLYYS